MITQTEALFGMLTLICAVSMAVIAKQPKPTTGADAIIAIDVLIEPDAVMIKNANRANAQLRKNYPQGYALDAYHSPHITLVQRFVRAGDLDAVSIAVTKTVQSRPTLPLKLTAKGFETAEWAGVGVVVYVVERTPELLQLENEIVEAVQPFAVSGGTADAFAKAGGEQINTETIKYVEAFVPASTGEKYLPHVTLGTAQFDFAKELKAKPFKTFTFSGKNIAIYQLGNFGTAQKRLWAWKQ